MPNSKPLKLAIDIGGTFTDTVLMRGESEILASNKTPTTPVNPEHGALLGANHALQASGVKPQEISLFVHGTTLATNALIERRGARVATITTEGFRDILSIGYERRYSQYDINIDKPDLIVPRYRAYTVSERVSFEGEILKPLDETAIARICREFTENKIEAVGVCLLHAYANSTHEKRVKELILDQLPEVAVSLSSDISPEAREFDRLCTTIANAYIQPLIGTYLRSLSAEFSGIGIDCPILMMTASGGMTSLEYAAALPIRLLESGPAGGAILAARTAMRLDAKNVVSFDMGGTTAKICLIDNFKPQTTRKFEISRAERFIKGSGMPVRIPVIDMIEIGAGGGSIASVDQLGRLLVGPRSAGSEPGPAAFAKGGTEPTVTDADFALGYLDAADFAEGQITLDTEANKKALQTGVADPLGVKIEQAAMGISEIVDENMASAARMHAVESGRDLAERTMIAFGGNGPLHATRVARKAGIETILIPPDPGVGSAVGFLHAPISFEIIRSRYTILEEFDTKSIDQFFYMMERQARAVVESAALHEKLKVRKTAFMRYQGQGHELEIELPDDIQRPDIIQLLCQAFEKEYKRQFSRVVPGMTVEILNWGLSVSTDPNHSEPPDAKMIIADTKSEERVTVFCDITGKPIEAQKCNRTDLAPGSKIAGPALICEPQTTTWVATDFTAEVDPNFNLWLCKKRPLEDLS